MTSSYRLPARLNRKIGQAMHDYSMFAEGDRVMIAVSGGADSLALAGILSIWQRKAPIRFTLAAHHIDHGFWRAHDHGLNPAVVLVPQLSGLGLALHIACEREVAGERSCFVCARNRRSQLFELARDLGCNKIAFGHHKDDLIETFFLNTIYSGNISTMVPRQDIFDGRLSLVRPMAYLEKHEVRQIAGEMGLVPVKNLCPLSDCTRRDKVRKILKNIYDDEPGAKESVFAALANVRREYLL